LKNKKMKDYHFHSIGRKLFFFVITLFLVLIVVFIAFQNDKEKKYELTELNTQLQSYNYRLNIALGASDKIEKDSILLFLKKKSVKELRLTIIKDNGKVLYDNVVKNIIHMQNHSNRKEVKKAIANGSGTDIKRTSGTTGKRYFYSATYFPEKNYIIRTAMPYTTDLLSNIKTDKEFLWITLFIAFFFFAVFYKFVLKLGSGIDKLQQFSQKADRNESIDTENLSKFPDNELGEISKHIIKIYKRLHKTKGKLYIEREKLITHLHIAREGLAIFKSNLSVILANQLFKQYSNIISDKELSSTEEILSLPELKTVKEFIEQYLCSKKQSENKTTSLNIKKNGKFFVVKCVIFQDDTFEISINDISHQEEQVLLKRQLTQNIAHELKTPVSSIHGYLETILNNKNITEEKKRFFLEHCFAQSNRLANLLQDISVLNEMEDAEDIKGYEDVNLSVMVNNMLSDVNLQLEKKKIIVINELEKNIIIPGNPSLLYSIFRNLTDNTIAYAGEGIHIHINCFRKDDSFYYFNFSDNGIGVPEKHLTRLFERFYRVDKGRSRKIGGTGLGLAIVKNAVQMHGGNIIAKKAKDGGLSFIFTIRFTKIHTDL